MKRIVLLGGSLLLLFLAGAFALYLSACEDDWCMHFEWQKVRMTNNFEDCVARGFPVMESYPRQCRAGDKTFVEEIEERKNIVVTKPLPGEEVGFPLLIEGKASTFESTVNFRIRDADNSILLEHFTTAETEVLGELAPFHAEVSYPEPKGSSGFVEVFEASAEDGSDVSLVRIPVFFRPVNTQEVRIYFSNSREDPETLHCDVTYPTPRRIKSEEDPMRGAILELLEGPMGSEQQQGFFTSINPGVTLLDFTFVDGVATANFSTQMQFELGGSCRVSAIRSQITETLKQFPGVTEVVIAVEGESEGVLQP